MVTHADVIVVGAGVFGLAAAAELARRGSSVRVLERGSIPHPAAASTGPSRKIRARYTDPRYSALARQAFDEWRSIERRAGDDLLVPVGNLLFSISKDLAPVERIRKSMAEAGITHHVLDAAAMAVRYPQLAGATAGLLEADAGYLRASRCVMALRTLALDAGAAISTRTKVWAIEPAGSRVAVDTARGRFVADRVVVAAGCWSRSLLPDLASRLTIARQGLAYVAGVPRPYRVGPFVPFGMIGDGYYGFPADGRVGLKLAFHDVEEVVDDPDFDRSAVSRSFIERTEWFLRTVLRLPADRYEVTYASCAYNLSASGDFLIDHYPRIPGVFLATAGSGHGFKFGSVIGRVIADRLDGVATSGWWDAFSYANLERTPAAVLP